MSACTDALLSQQETGKIAASIALRCGRLPPSMSCRFNADSETMFRVELTATAVLSAGRFCG
jgi:hypothetical protein